MTVFVEEDGTFELELKVVGPVFEEDDDAVAFNLADFNEGDDAFKFEFKLKLLVVCFDENSDAFRFRSKLTTS